MRTSGDGEVIEPFPEGIPLANAFQYLFENASDAIYILDKHGNFVAVNRKAEELTGFKREDFLGKSFRKIVPVKSMLKAVKGFLVVIRGKSIRLELELRTAAKKAVPVELTSVPLIINGKVVGTFGIVRDITERKQMEKKLEEYSQHLEELVEKRTAQLKEAQRQLLQAERLAAIGEVAAIVGHDLRNPLTGIDGATYYLKTKLGAKMDPKTREMFDLIEKNIEYSNNLVTSLLEYSREIRLEKVQTNPKSIMKEVLSLIKAPENIQVLDLTKSEPKIEVDVEIMKRVFINIIKNAMEAMPEGGQLMIKSEEKNGSLQIAFTDTGIGMPKEVLEKIWAPFFTTKAKGMGLGLSICKRFVEAHGGSISVKSAVEKGTTFTVTVPIKTEPEGGEKVWLKPPESLLSTTTRA